MMFLQEVRARITSLCVGLPPLVTRYCCGSQPDHPAITLQENDFLPECTPFVIKQNAVSLEAVTYLLPAPYFACSATARR